MLTKMDVAAFAIAIALILIFLFGVDVTST
jgi:hypothetical protein